jgi:hypothetical protein
VNGRWVADGGTFTLFQWSGNAAHPPVPVPLPPFDISP